MEIHVKVLGVLFAALSALGVLFAIVLLIGIGGAASIVGASAPPDEAAYAIPIIGVAGSALVALMLIFSLPGFVTGLGLLYFKPWARIVGIVLSALQLLGFPIGTAIGIYGLWVLLSKDTERLFNRVAVTTPGA